MVVPALGSNGVSFKWGSFEFKNFAEFKEWAKENLKPMKVRDEGKVRHISEVDTGIVIDQLPLHPVVQASGRVWYSSWYKPEYPYKRKSKTLKQRLKELEPAE